MNEYRDRRVHFLLSGMILLLAVAGVITQPNFDEVKISTTKLAENVYVMMGAGGNIGVSAGKDGVVLIDDEYTPLTQKVKAAVVSISDQPIKFVINTHWHNDHTGGNEDLGEAGAVIVAHETVRNRLSTEQCMSFFNLRTPPSPEAALPVVTFAKEVSLHVNGDELHVFHVAPGHTDGDVIIHWRDSNVIHAGDLFFTSSYPFIDLDSGGAIGGIIAAADQMIDLADEATQVIPGHGTMSNKKDLMAWRDMVTTIRSRIEMQMKEGKSLDEILASKPTEEFDEKWGKGFIEPDQFVQLVHQSLSG